jgi:hypothetical protein
MIAVRLLCCAVLCVSLRGASQDEVAACESFAPSAIRACIGRDAQQED